MLHSAHKTLKKKNKYNPGVTGVFHPPPDDDCRSSSLHSRPYILFLALVRVLVLLRGWGALVLEGRSYSGRKQKAWQERKGAS